jgi:predicted transcriptional regulator
VQHVTSRKQENSMATKAEKREAQATKINITLKLDKDLVRKIRVLAAENGTSISALLSAKLEEELGRRTAYEEAKKQALAVLAKGWDLGGCVPTREEMHER